MKIDAKKQAKFFDVHDHQYQEDALRKPPVHTQYELNRFQKILKKALSSVQSKPSSKAKKRIIDFGSGTGRISIPLLREGFQVIALDISKESLSNLEKLAKSLKLEKKLSTVSSFSDSKTPQSADAIVGTDILHHVNLEEYIQTFPKHLRKRGVILFSEPNAYNPAWYLYFPLHALFNGMSVIEYIKVESGFLQCRPPHVKKLLKQSGFKTVKLYGHGILPPPVLSWSPKLSKLNYYLSDLPILRLFAYRILIFASLQ